MIEGLGERGQAQMRATVRIGMSVKIHILAMCTRETQVAETSLVPVPFVPRGADPELA